MWIHLRHNKVVDVEYLRQTGHGQIAVHRAIDILSVEIIPRHRLFGDGIFGHENKRSEHKRNRARHSPRKGQLCEVMNKELPLTQPTK